MPCSKPTSRPPRPIEEGICACSPPPLRRRRPRGDRKGHETDERALDVGILDEFKEIAGLVGGGRFGPPVYWLHAPAVECIGKGKAHRSYEFGVRVTVATTLRRSKGDQFIALWRRLPEAPYGGHTLATVIREIESQISANLARLVADRGYRGHNAASEDRFKVYISG
jgi:hypothetical protein